MDINRRNWVIAALLSLTALIVPLWVTEIPPLVDVPNHATRIYILANYETNEAFRRTFELVLEPIPNMALDLILVPIVNTVGIWNAVRLFLTLTVLLFALGCFLISTADGEQASFSAIIAWFTIYGSTLFYGYANYLFSVSLFLVAFGLWLRWRNSYSVHRLAVLVLLGCAIYLSHLSSFVFLWLAVVIIRLCELRIHSDLSKTGRGLAVDALIFIPATVALVFFMFRSEGSGVLEWNNLQGKMTALFGPFISFDPLIDATVLALVILFFVTFLITSKIKVDRPLLTVGVIFLFIFALAPEAFITGDADLRIVLPGMALVITSLRFEEIRNEIVAGFAIILIALICRQAVIGYRFVQIDEMLRGEIAVLRTIPAGSKVLTLKGRATFEQGYKIRRPIEHIVQVVTMINGSLTPTLFAIRGQNPLVFREQPVYFSIENEDPKKWLEALPNYDLVWTNGVPDGVIRELEQRADKLSDNGRTKLWKVKQNAAN